jgi:hypothetical protein
MTRTTQEQRILNLLEAHRGEWVPLPKILDLHIAQYGARIYRLRRQGHAIENKSEYVGQERHTWFRLTKED